MLEFWVIFIFQLLLGNVNGGQISAIDNESLTPTTATYLEWNCGDETCYLVYENGNWETGP